MLFIGMNVVKTRNKEFRITESTQKFLLYKINYTISDAKNKENKKS